MKMQNNPEGLGIYVHIPFCVRKCNYCDFLSFTATKETKEAYFDALKREMDSYCGAGHQKPRTIYFGGGTPSSVEPEYIEDILCHMKKCFSVDIWKPLEVTLEVNPKTVDSKKWKQYKQMGINRISMGLQSTHEEELKLLGRIHDYDDFLESFYEAREAGFDNISVDVMAALPGQSLEKYKETLERVVLLQPEHISSYSLIVEEGTPFEKLYGEGAPKEHMLPDEELDRKMYQLTQKLLKDHGYHRYEISNYARPGRESKHNSSYWERIPYIGLGLGASSFFDGKRYQNTSDMKQYLKHSQDRNIRVVEEEVIGRKEAMEEFMFLGLRKTKGVLKSDFKHFFGTEMENIYGTVLKSLSAQQVLIEEEDVVRLSEYGLDVSNMVLSHFLLEEER